jgi:anoctamin-1
LVCLYKIGRDVASAAVNMVCISNVLSRTFSLQSKASSCSSLYFRDGIRSVDFVLVWDDLIKHSNSEASEGKRKVFEKNLQREG